MDRELFNKVLDNLNMGGIFHHVTFPYIWIIEVEKDIDWIYIKSVLGVLGLENFEISKSPTMENVSIIEVLQ